MDTKEPLALERRQPYLFQDGKGLYNRIPLREDHKGVAGEQCTAQLPRELSKQALYPISADGTPEPLPNHNTNPAATHVSPTNHHIKQGCRDATAVLLGILDIATAFQE
jgi:hypothetical protein